MHIKPHRQGQNSPTAQDSYHLLDGLQTGHISEGGRDTINRCLMSREHRSAGPATLHRVMARTKSPVIVIGRLGLLGWVIEAR